MLVSEVQNLAEIGENGVLTFGSLLYSGYSEKLKKKTVTEIKLTIVSGAGIISYWTTSYSSQRIDSVSLCRFFYCFRYTRITVNINNI